jgi:ribosomal protein L11 methyltransferase
MVLAELLELVPGGVEEVELSEGLVEYAVYGAPGELPSLPALRAAAGEGLVDVVSAEVPESWEHRWRQFHRPLVLGSRLTVRPPWEPPGGSDLDVVVDPGQAFGTGAHATTRLCLELMLELPAGGPFLDLGSGSGVLAIVAAKLGFDPVLALDHDPAAVEATRANADTNGVSVDVRRFDLRTEAVPWAPITVANLLAPLLLALAERLGPGQAGPQRLIVSGLLISEADRVAHTFARHGLRAVTRRERGDWAAVLLQSG